ncbi:hypothetical protein SARC_09090 [Sphaeroforma arctica JP610]|uniref:BHLH domain-containing protein n=1 Tax=Sphaeroforma arctica JP610 TaxID=667725 RepID=A0A0L0FNV6_9EUKA|nr:hypothetical protein SARC_09090 [Sphaeroforma arctica JP610]KNC78487.1 hypothetical protein SARC_09090 [Sphaeroforma arctica JP610]|eukprot:XP_014152389.1 hypothetical protein SARC_09090 [Sphaeroforma arctica JP610]
MEEYNDYKAYNEKIHTYPQSQPSLPANHLFDLLYQSISAPTKNQGNGSDTFTSTPINGGDHSLGSSNTSSLASPPLAWLTSDEEELGQNIDVSLVDELLQETLGLGATQLSVGIDANGISRVWYPGNRALPVAPDTSHFTPDITHNAKEQASHSDTSVTDAYENSTSPPEVITDDGTPCVPVVHSKDERYSNSPEPNSENSHNPFQGNDALNVARKTSEETTHRSDTNGDGSSNSRKSSKASYSKRKQATERKRIQSISEAFDVLKSVVPSCAGAKAARVTILQRTAQHIIAQNQVIERLKAKLELLASDKDRTSVIMATGADANHMQLLPGVSRMGSMPAMGYTAQMADASNHSIIQPPHSLTHAAARALRQSQVQGLPQAQMYPGGTCVAATKAMYAQPPVLGSAMCLNSFSVAPETQDLAQTNCMCMVCVGAGLSVYDQVYAQTAGPPPHAQRIHTLDSQAHMHKPERTQAQIQTKSLPNMRVQMPTAAQVQAQIQTQSLHVPQAQSQTLTQRESQKLSEQKTAKVVLTEHGSSDCSTAYSATQRCNTAPTNITEFAFADTDVDSLINAGNGIVDMDTGVCTNKLTTPVNALPDTTRDSQIQLMGSSVGQKSQGRPQGVGSCTITKSGDSSNWGTTDEGFGTTTSAGGKRKRQAAGGAVAGIEEMEAILEECVKSARVEGKDGHVSVSADGLLSGVKGEGYTQTLRDIQTRAHAHAQSQARAQVPTPIPPQAVDHTKAQAQMQTRISEHADTTQPTPPQDLQLQRASTPTQEAHTIQQQQPVHPHAVSPPINDALSELQTVEKPSTSYGGGNTRTLMSVCLFLLMSPTSRWVMDSMQQSSDINPTGRVLHSLGVNETRYSGYMTNMFILILSRAMPHVLLCVRSLAALLFARVVLLIAEPSGFISKDLLKEVQEIRQKVDSAFQNGSIAEAEEMAIQGLALCGHHPLQLTGIKLLAHWLTQCGHHQLRNWRIGALVDTVVLAPRDISPLREIAHLYFQLYLIKVFYRGQDDLQAIHLQTSALNYAEVCDARYPADTLLTQIYVSETFAMERLFPQFHYISRFYQHRALSRVLKYGQNHMKKVEEIKLFQEERSSACRFQVFPGLLIISLLLVGASVIQFTTYAFEIDGQADHPLFQYLMIIPTILLLPLAVLTCFPP